MSWKDYFYFSKSQRIGLATIIIAILIVSIGNLFLDKLLPPQNSFSNTLSEKELTEFLNSLEENKPRFEKWKYERYKYKKTEYEQHASQTIILFQFNPNTLDSIGFSKLGLRPYQIKNILKFRKKGGEFRFAQDFKKLYGLSAEQYAILEAYILIPQTNKVVKAENVSIINLNKADSAQLTQIKGVYPSLAKRIISYRKKLGGYANSSQLQEVWGLEAELANKIAEHTLINKNEIEQIAINKASVDKLRAHPYINFYQAKAIYEYRKDKGNIKSFNELQHIEADCFNDEFWRKIEPYLEFNSHF